MDNSSKVIKIAVCLIIIAVCVTLTMYVTDRGTDVTMKGVGMLTSAAGNVDDRELLSYNNKKIDGSIVTGLLNIYGLKYPVMITTSQVPTGFYNINRISVESSDQYIQPTYKFTFQVVLDVNDEVQIILVTQDGVPQPNYDITLARKEFENAVTTRYEVAVKQYNLFLKQAELNKAVDTWCEEGMNHLQNSGHDANSVTYWESQYAACAQLTKELSTVINNKISLRLQ